MTRTLIQDPGGGFVEFEGSVNEEVANFFMTALVNPQGITVEMLLTLKRFSRELGPKPKT